MTDAHRAKTRFESLNASWNGTAASCENGSRNPDPPEEAPMPARKSLLQLIQKHEADATYAETKSQEWAAKATVSRNRASALKAQAKEAAGE